MENKEKDIQIIIAGAAGQGSKKAGHLIGKLFNSYGFRVFIHEDYESVIRGGHNFSQISVSKEECNAISDKIDFLLALNKDAVENHSRKMKEEGVLIYDSDSIKEEDLPSRADLNIVPVSLNEIIKEAEGIDLMKNTALVSLFMKVVGMDFEKASAALKKELPVKTEENMRVARTAFEKVDKLRELKEGGSHSLPLLAGNEAAALGAINAGLESYFAYPMTPSTGILNFLSKTKGVKTFQPESELAVINMGLGSSYAGKRTMVGTSGGGFALMTEGISFSAQAEIPICVALSQRMGPATGVPTYQAQADLLFASSSGHGDMMRFIVAPGDADEAYELTGKALNISWKYQLPSIVLLDKELSENTYGFKGESEVFKEDVVTEDKEDYERYAGESISPLAFPGGRAMVKATGYEHDSKGIAVEDANKVKEMHEKRLRKYENLREELKRTDTVRTCGEGDVAIVFWGSTKGVVMEATKGMGVKIVWPLVIQPFPEKKMKEVLSGTSKIICVETNATGQLAKMLRCYGTEVEGQVLKYDGRPFTIEELKERIESLL